MVQAAICLPLLVFLGLGVIQHSFVLIAHIYAKQVSAYAARAFLLDGFPLKDGNVVAAQAAQLVIGHVNQHYLNWVGTNLKCYSVACTTTDGNCSNCNTSVGLGALPPEMSLVVESHFKVPSLVKLPIPGFSEETEVIESTTMRFH